MIVSHTQTQIGSMETWQSSYYGSYHDDQSVLANLTGHRQHQPKGSTLSIYPYHASTFKSSSFVYLSDLLISESLSTEISDSFTGIQLLKLSLPLIFEFHPFLVFICFCSICFACFVRSEKLQCWLICLKKCQSFEILLFQFFSLTGKILLLQASFVPLIALKRFYVSLQCVILSFKHQ